MRQWHRMLPCPFFLLMRQWHRMLPCPLPCLPSWFAARRGREASLVAGSKMWLCLMQLIAIVPAIARWMLWLLVAAAAAAEAVMCLLETASLPHAAGLHVGLAGAERV